MCWAQCLGQSCQSFIFLTNQNQLVKVIFKQAKTSIVKGTEPNCLGLNEKGSGERYDEEGDKWSCDGDAEGVRFDDSVDTMCTTCQDVYEGEEVHPK